MKCIAAERVIINNNEIIRIFEEEDGDNVWNNSAGNFIQNHVLIYYGIFVFFARTVKHHRLFTHTSSAKTSSSTYPLFIYGIGLVDY